MQVLPALESGGVERGTLEVAAHLVAAGHRSLVLSGGGRMVPALQASGSTHIQWPVGQKSLWSLRLIPQLRALWLREQVDIVHVRSRFPAWLVYLAWRSMPLQQRPRLVTTVHGCYSENVYSRIMTAGERVIVISQAVQDYVYAAYQTPPEKCRLIYRGVDTHSYHHGRQPPADWLEAWYQAYPQTRDAQLLVLPARLTRWKGQADFIKLLHVVMPQLQQQGRKVHALLVGEVDPRKRGFEAELRQQIAESGLNDAVTLTGYRADVQHILSIASIVYSLSLQPEAFGRTTLEALSMGVPVIGYAHGGVAEQLAVMLPDGAVQPGNVAEAAMLTLSWLAQPPVVRPNTAFSLQNMLTQTMQVYHEVMADTVCAALAEVA